MLKKVLSDPYYIYIRTRFSENGINDLIADFDLLLNDDEISFIRGLLTLIKTQKCTSNEILAQLIFFIGKERNNFIDKFLRKIDDETPYLKTTQTTHRYHLKSLERVETTGWEGLSLSIGNQLRTFSTNEISKLKSTKNNEYFVCNKKLKELIIWNSSNFRLRKISLGKISDTIISIDAHWKPHKFICVCANQTGDLFDVLVFNSKKNRIDSVLHSSSNPITALQVNNKTIIICEQYEVYSIKNKKRIKRCSLEVELKNEGIKQILYNLKNQEYYFIGWGNLYILDASFNFQLKIPIADTTDSGVGIFSLLDIQQAVLSNDYLAISTKTKLCVINLKNRKKVFESTHFMGTPITITNTNIVILKDQKLIKAYVIKEQKYALFENPFPETLSCISTKNDKLIYIYTNGVISQWKNIQDVNGLVSLNIEKRQHVELGKTKNLFYFKKESSVVVLTEKYLHFITEVNTPLYLINRKITQAKKSERYKRIVILEENVLWSINSKTKEIWRVDFNDGWNHKSGAENNTFEIYESLGVIFCLREVYDYDNEDYEFIGMFFDIEKGNLTRQFNTAILGIKIPIAISRRERGSRNRTSDSLFALMEGLKLLVIFLADRVLVLNPFDTICKLVRIIPLEEGHKTMFKYSHFAHQDLNNIYFSSYDIGFKIDIKNNVVESFKSFSFFIQDMIVSKTNRTSVLFGSENFVSLYSIKNNEILTSFDLKNIDVQYDSDVLARYYDFENDMLFLSTHNKVIIISLKQEKIILNLNTIFQFHSIVPTKKNLFMLGDDKGFIYEVALENYNLD